jgi:predicted Zn-dependent protease with MMP-like domain
LNREEFERLIDRSLRRLPKKFADALENIVVEVEDEPEEEVLEEMRIEDDGLYGL